MKKRLAILSVITLALALAFTLSAQTVYAEKGSGGMYGPGGCPLGDGGHDKKMAMMLMGTDINIKEMADGVTVSITSDDPTKARELILMGKILEIKHELMQIRAQRMGERMKDKKRKR